MCGESILGSNSLILDPIMLVLNSPGQPAESHHLWNIQKCVRTSETRSQMEILPRASIEVRRQDCHTPFLDVHKIEPSKNREPLAMTHMKWSVWRSSWLCFTLLAVERSYCVVPTISLSFSFVACSIKACAQMLSEGPSSSDVLLMCFHTFQRKEVQFLRARTGQSHRMNPVSYLSSLQWSFPSFLEHWLHHLEFAIYKSYFLARTDYSSNLFT